VLQKLDDISKTYSSFLDRPENQDLREEVERYRGIALYELGKPLAALPLLETAATLEYEKPRTLYYLGRSCYDLGDLGRAKEFLRQALALDLRPLYQPGAHYVLGLCYHWQGQYARAIQELEWCIEHDDNELVPKWKVLTAVINALKALGLEREAERYSEVLRETPQTAG
jgi:tetratricopeptide (TPR) repeat protein